MQTNTFKQMKPIAKNILKFVVNNLLIVSGVATVISGFVLQLGFHIGSGGRHEPPAEQLQNAAVEPLRAIETTHTVWGLDYISWTVVHKTVIVLLSILMVYHLASHWKWYKAVFIRCLIGKTRQVIILSVLFVAVAFTGLAPWLVDLSGNCNSFRFFLIEIHDKLTLLLTIFLILHIVKRLKWFPATFRQLISQWQNHKTSAKSDKTY
jgi:hypothetical protein